jgi:hypothetical protein
VAQDHGPVADSCEKGEERLGSINGREFVNWLIDYQFL